MSATAQSRNGNGAAEASGPQDPCTQERAEPLLAQAAPLTDEVRAIIADVNTAAMSWRDALAVGIGRASALTGLKETQIRYFEEIGALQPTKTAGASRLYTLADLRRLYALALLLKRYRPAEAATLVRTYTLQIESGSDLELVDLLQQESSAITDGFLLARLMSQLMDAARIELCSIQASTTQNGQTSTSHGSSHGAESVRVIGLILPLRPVLDVQHLTSDEVQHIGRALASAPVDIPVALDRGAIMMPPSTRIPPALNDTGRDDTTLLFYSREAWELPGWDRCYYCVYIPPAHSDLTLLVMVTVPEGVQVPHILRPETPARVVLFNHILLMCGEVFKEFRRVIPPNNYRYRSDGFQIEQTQRSYQKILKTIHALIFGEDAGGMAVLFIPNSLDQPTSLSMLSHYGYDDDLASRAKLDLTGEGQGLSGRAYNLREPFLSLDAHADPRSIYGVEADCQTALAVPLASSWGIVPFGVLYLGSKNGARRLDSKVAYVALIIGNILSELIGRWWLTRLRRSLDDLLHRRVDEMIHWLDSLDQHGPGLEHALAAVKAVWSTIATHESATPQAPDDEPHTPVRQAQTTPSATPAMPLALVVLDIDTYRQRVQARNTAPIPLAAQLHVREAIHKIVPGIQDYWFKNDHAFLLLEKHDEAQAAAVVRRIANQVRALPLTLRGHGDRRITISISAAIQVMTYQDLYDLDSTGGPKLDAAVRAIIDDLRAHTKHSSGHQIQALTAEGWQVI